MAKPVFSLKDVSLTVRQEPISLARRLTGLLNGKNRIEGNSTLLKSINLTINEGDRIGLVGHNGAGKSTLLRVLAGIYQISEGTFVSDCKPYGLFSVNQGIIPRASGIDNIYIKALSIGMSKAEVNALIPRIVRFSGLGKDIRRPVQHYSDGMRLRLAVAISLTIDTEFLLLDEWIGSGDKLFRQKIESRLNVMLENSKGMVLATHHHALIRRLCNRCLVLRQGEIIFDDTPEEALKFIGDAP